MANGKIRVRLRAFDAVLIDQSAKAIVQTVQKAGAKVSDPDMGDSISVTVIATGFSTSIEENVEVPVAEKTETKVVPDGNVLSYGDFDSLLRPSAKTESSVTTQTSPVNESKGFLFDEVGNAASDTAKKSGREGSTLGSALTRVSMNPGDSSLNPPAGYNVSANDINQPACWRRGTLKS